jgi:hypothetical protein
MSGNTGSTNNAATELSHLQAAYRELYKQVKDLRAERDRQAAEIGRLQSQIRDMQRSLPMMRQSRNGNGNSGRGGPPGFRMGGSKSRKNRKTRKSRKN